MDVMAEQQPDSPDRGEAHTDQEGCAEQSSRDIALAPALEHSGESSEEENDSDDSKSFEPHLLISLLAGCHGGSRRESAGVTARGDSGSGFSVSNTRKRWRYIGWRHEHLTTIIGYLQPDSP